jgi:hypothetical protein
MCMVNSLEFVIDRAVKLIASPSRAEPDSEKRVEWKMDDEEGNSSCSREVLRVRIRPGIRRE